MATQPPPTDEALEVFKTQVRTYIEIDDDIRKLKKALNERLGMKKELSGVIQQFMCSHGIEDLNTRHGTIRYKITRCKQPLSQSLIKRKLVEWHNPTLSGTDLAKKIFDERPIMERHSLRRVTMARNESS